MKTIAFPVPGSCAVDGPRLAEEIQDATGVDVSGAYGLAADGATLLIAASVVGEQTAAIQAVIDAHTGTPLAEYKARALARIDAEAEACRLRFVTSGATMAMVYAEKDAEAKRYRADPAPDPVNYPILAAEAQATGKTLAEVVVLVEQTRAEWMQLAAYTEGLRRGAKVAVLAATTHEQVDAAADVAWPPAPDPFART